jgi:hypothetical protein
MFSTNPLLIANLLDPGMILFGVMLVLFGAAVAMAALLGQHPRLAYVLAAFLILLLLAFAGHMVVNLFLPSTAVVAQSIEATALAFLAHRWIILELAKVLLFTSIVLLVVYGPRIVEKHAKHYYWTVMASVGLSFLVLLVTAFESVV